MNQIDLALEQLDAETIKTESDLSFKMSITTVEKGLKEMRRIGMKTNECFLDDKLETPETTPPIPKGTNESKSLDEILALFLQEILSIGYRKMHVWVKRLSITISQQSMQ